MPVERGPRIDTRSALVVGLSGVLAAVLLGALVLWITSRGDRVEVRLGDDRFESINAESAAERIAEDGPLLFPDVAGRGRDIIVMHLGKDPERGWYAFDARPRGETRDCFLRWDADTEQFRANEHCEQPRTVPADGEGLRQYPAVVEDGRVIIDVQVDARATTTEPAEAGDPTGS